MIRTVWRKIPPNAGSQLARSFCNPPTAPIPAAGEPAINPLLRELCSKIRFGGPLTLAQYMSEALTHPKHGYYTRKKTVLGSSGDFVTSPEVSQMFGECLGIWILHETRKMVPPGTPINLVELGPGHGTLMDDILRTMAKVEPGTLKGVQVHLVEVSEVLRQTQRAKLCGYDSKVVKEAPSRGEVTIPSKYGPVNVHWYSQLHSVPRGFSVYLAHEFFDALPIHQFVRAETDSSTQWHEVLVDLAPGDSDRLRLIRSRNATPMATLIDPVETKDIVELCPRAGSLIQSISERVVQHGGSALIADYGHDGDKREATFRAFKDHHLHDPLSDPGLADLTADVNFAYLKKNCAEGALAYGPVPQSDFLHRLGIQVRLEKLLSACKNEARKAELQSAYDHLTQADKMGSRFQFMAVLPEAMKALYQREPPAGFS